MNPKTRSTLSVPCLACLLSLICAVSAPAATSIVWTARSVTVNTNGAVTAPDNFWAANSNSIVAITGVGAAATNTVTVDTNGVVSSPTNFWSANAGQFPTGTNTVTVTTNGVVASPANFWSANAGSIPAATNVVTVSTNGVVSSPTNFWSANAGSIPAATNVVTINTNGVVTSPTNFWAANSNNIASVVKPAGTILGTPDQITVTTNGPTNTLSFPTTLILPGKMAVGKTAAATAVDILGAITVDGSLLLLYNTTNLALHKITAQNAVSDGDSTNAVDGNLGTHCQTPTSIGSWWKVDLGASHTVGKIVINKDGWTTRPASFKIQSAADYAFTENVTDIVATTNTQTICTLDGNTMPVFTTRYIRLMTLANNYITMSEFAAYEIIETASLQPSTFNGPVNLGMVHGPVTIGTLSGALSAFNGVVSASVLPIALGGTGTTNGLFCTNDVLVSAGTTNRMIWSGGILLSNIPNFHE